MGGAFCQPQNPDVYRVTVAVTIPPIKPKLSREFSRGGWRYVIEQWSSPQRFKYMSCGNKKVINSRSDEETTSEQGWPTVVVLIKRNNE